MKYSLEY